MYCICSFFILRGLYLLDSLATIENMRTSDLDVQLMLSINYYFFYEFYAILDPFNAKNDKCKLISICFYFAMTESR